MSSNASPAQIHHAYREWAKRYHPDTSGHTAADEFLRIKEAYDVLGDPTRRAAYDGRSERKPSGSGARPDTEPANSKPRSVVEPVRCSKCQAVSVQPRFCEFERVLSGIVFYRIAYRQGVFCSKCAASVAVSDSIFTWLFGWWSVVGIVLSPVALWRNATLGTKPRSQNFSTLVHQSLYFVGAGKNDLAAHCLSQAEKFADAEGRSTITELRALLGGVHASSFLLDQWNVWRRMTTLLHVAPVVGLSALCLVFASQQIPSSGSSAARSGATPAQVGSQASAEKNTPYYVTAPVAQAWTQQSGSYVVQSVLPKFTTVQITGVAPDPNFMNARLRDGTVVTIAKSAMTPGDGKTAKLAWCSASAGAPPYNGEYFKKLETGPNKVTVKNLGSDDAVIKFRDPFGIATISGFVAANSEARFDNFPDGTFLLEFATGRNWSRSCGMFTVRMATSKFPSGDEFTSWKESVNDSRGHGTITHFQEGEYTITPVVNGNVKTQSISEDEFLMD